MSLVMAADPDRVVEPLDLNVVDVATVHPSLTREACLESMHLVRRDGRVVAGFDAVATLARWLPPGWPLGALALVPGVAPVGRRIYHAIAASRPRDVPCTDEVCVPERATLSTTVQLDAAARPDPRFDAWRARLPAPLGSPAAFAVDGNRIRIGIPLPASLPLAEPHFFAAEDQVVAYAAPQRFSRKGDLLIVELERAKIAPKEPGRLAGRLLPCDAHGHRLRRVIGVGQRRRAPAYRGRLARRQRA